MLADLLPYVTLLLRARGNTGTERRALARRKEFDRIVADLVAEAAGDGDLRPDVDPAVTARLLFGMVNSLVEWYQPGRRRADDALADAVCAVAFDGLRLRRPAPPPPVPPPPRASAAPRPPAIRDDREVTAVTRVTAVKHGERRCCGRSLRQAKPAMNAEMVHMGVHQTHRVVSGQDALRRPHGTDKGDETAPR